MMFSYVDQHLPPIAIPETEQQRRALRDRILKVVGLEDLAKRGPVRWISKGRIERDTYRIEKILIETYPGMMVPGLVYVPNKLAGTAPAMISIPGHVYCEGKASDSVQARCVNLARRGIIALTYDYIDTGERNTGANACASMPYGGGNDHGLKGFSYTSGTPTGLEILDGVRAVDYLYTRPDVDRSRLGFTGESGGSNSTYWVSALDERVKLAVPVCSVTTFDYWIRNDRNWDWHQRPAGIRRIAEIPTLLALIAPRPLLVIGSLRGTDSEEFPFDQTEEAVRRACRAYELSGARQNIEIWESSTSHGYQQDKRERMYAFVEKHFLHRGRRRFRRTGVRSGAAARPGVRPARRQQDHGRYLCGVAAPAHARSAVSGRPRGRGEDPESSAAGGARCARAQRGSGAAPRTGAGNRQPRRCPDAAPDCGAGAGYPPAGGRDPAPQARCRSRYRAGQIRGTCGSCGIDPRGGSRRCAGRSSKHGRGRTRQQAH